MQRITRETFACSDDSLQQLTEGVALLQRHFPPSIASLFAIPRNGHDGNLQWWSELGGQPRPFAELNSQAQSQLLERLQQRQAAIEKLAAALQSGGQPQEAERLRFLLGTADTSNLYSLNDEPVLVRWGLPPRPEPVSPEPARSQAPPVAPPPVIKKRYFLIPWWLILLLLLPLLLFLLWWLWQWSTPYWSKLDFDPDPKPAASFACTPAAEPPDFVVVLDTSGSMNLNIKTSHADEQWFFEQGNHLSKSHPRVKQVLAGPSRFEVAQQGLEQIIGDLHPAIDTHLLTFNGCHAIRNHGLFNHAQHPQLRQELAGLIANGGTPLGTSLQQAAKLVDGRNKDAVILMFADGEDGCEVDACAVAANIAREQPRLRVNVVNISESRLSDCIAEHTGGQVFASTDSKRLLKQLRNAVNQVADDPNCEAED